MTATKGDITVKKLIVFVVTLICLFALIGCTEQQQTNEHPTAAAVPDRGILIGNLEVNGYVITTQASVEGSNLAVDRIIAEKGSSFIDIVYCLSPEEAIEIFDVFFNEIYQDDYYVLSREDNYIYCASDEETFRISGIVDTASVGIERIDN